MEIVSYTTEVVADSVQFLEPRSATAERSRSGAVGWGTYQGSQQSEQPNYQNQHQTNNINNQINKTIHVLMMIHFRQAEVR